jgi:hypothetical protein
MQIPEKNGYLALHTGQSRFLLDIDSASFLMDFM